MEATPLTKAALFHQHSLLSDWSMQSTRAPTHAATRRLKNVHKKGDRISEKTSLINRKRYQLLFFFKDTPVRWRAGLTIDTANNIRVASETSCLGRGVRVVEIKIST